MKSSSMLSTPVFGEKSSKKIVEQAQHKLSTARKARLEELDRIAKAAFKKP